MCTSIRTGGWRWSTYWIGAGTFAARGNGSIWKSTMGTGRSVPDRRPSPPAQDRSDSAFGPFSRVVHSACFKADDLPLPEPAVIDAVVAVLPADVAGAVGPRQFGTRSHNGRVAINAHFQVIQVERCNVEGPCAAQGERFGLGFNRPIRADTNVVIGQQTVHYAYIVVQLCQAPLHFQRFNFLVQLAAAAVRKGGKCRYSRKGKQKQKKSCTLHC